VKSFIKYIGIICIGLLYCFAMSVAGREASALHSHKPISHNEEVKFDFSDSAFTITGTTGQYVIGKTIAKSGSIAKFKIPFNGFQVSLAGHDFKSLCFFTITRSVHHYTSTCFGSIDMIYPFHSFW
jgi:hypothetical protein